MPARFQRYLTLFLSLWCFSAESAVVDFGKAKGEELIVKFSPRGTALDRVRALKNTRQTQNLSGGPARQNAGALTGLVRLELAPGVAVGAELARLAQNPAIEFVEPNYPLTLCVENELVVPNDFEFSRMYALLNSGLNGGKNNAHIHATEAWSHTTGSSNIVVAVIDTGIDYFHEDLRPNLWRNTQEIPGNGVDDDGNGYVDDWYGYDFVSGDSDPFDDNNHGTHVAGTIGAAGNNGIGTVGVCWSVSMMALKAFNERGAGTVSGAIEAIHFAVENGAQIINASWSSNEKSRALEEAVNAATEAGVLFVAAAGNSGSDSFVYPGAYEAVIAVAATDHKDARAPFSNHGAWVDVAAPGLNILSTLPENSYGIESGTSMAAPHVAGVAALVLSRFPDYTPQELRTILMNSVEPIVTDRRIGHGRLNAALAVQMDEPLPAAQISLEPQLYGTVQIRGSAHGRFFSGYSLNAKAGSASSGAPWTVIASGVSSVTNGILAEFDTSVIADGPVTIQLLVTNRNGHKALAAAESRIFNTLITAPLSADVLPPGQREVRGHLVGALTFTLEYSQGLNPATWIPIASGIGGGLDRLLGTWNTATLEDDFYTLRLVSSNLTGRTEFTAPLIRIDSQLKPGFPVHLPAGAEFPVSDWRYIRPADLNNDGRFELVMIDAGTRQRPQRLLVYSISGELIWERILGYDIQPDLPAIGDMDGDGKLEIFVDGPEGVMAFNYLGESFSDQWPVSTQSSNHAKVLADVDEDGELELITFSQEYVARQVQEMRVLTIYKRDATVAGQWEIPWCGFTNEVHKIYPAVANLDGLPGLEIVVPSGCNEVAAYTPGQVSPLWRATTQGALISSPVMGDVDGNGSLDVVIAAAPENKLKGGGIYIFDHQGNLWSGYPVLEDHAFHASPALGDLDQDGRLEIVLPCRKEFELHVLQHDGFEADGWPQKVFHRVTARAGIALGDVNGDGQPDILAASPSLTGLAQIQKDTDYVFGVRAWQVDGSPIHLPEGSIPSLHFDNVGGERWQKSAPPVLGDFDQNGRLDLLAASIQGRTYGSFVRFKDRSSIYAWELPVASSAQPLEWPMFNQNIRNVGVYPFPLVSVPGPTNITLALRDRLICPEDGTLLLHPLTNDVAAVAGGLSLVHFAQPLHGTLTREGATALRYQPQQDFTGLDQFTYTIRDMAGTESTGLVLLKVKPVNDPPVVRDLDFTVNRNGSVNITYKAVDDEEDDLDYRIVTPPEHGELWNYPALGVYYPHAGFTGVDSFTYVANDGIHDSATARVTITVLDTNNAPTMVKQELLTKKNRPLEITPQAKDLDKDPVTFEITTGPAHGQAEWVEERIRYTPDLDFAGSDRILIRAFDGFDWGKDSVIGIQVIATNAIPVASSSSVTLPPNKASEIILGGVDPDGDPIEFHIVAEPLHGTVAGNPPVLTYTPEPDYQGPDRISFQVTDGESESELGVLNLQIIRQNSPPQAEDLALSVPADHPFLVPLNIVDPDHDPLETIILKGPAKGALYGTGTNFTYVPRLGALGPDEFTIKAWDGQRFGNVATVTLTLSSPTEPKPVFLELVWIDAEEIELRLSVQNQNPVQIESSVDLFTWEAASPILWPTENEYRFRETNSPVQMRFYRAISLE